MFLHTRALGCRLKSRGRLFHILIVVTLKVLPLSVFLLYQIKFTLAYLVFLLCCSRFNSKIWHKYGAISPFILLKANAHLLIYLLEITLREKSVSIRCLCGVYKLTLHRFLVPSQYAPFPVNPPLQKQV